jgi:hypothetical protein
MKTEAATSVKNPEKPNIPEAGEVKEFKKTAFPSVSAPQPRMTSLVLCWIIAQMSSANWPGAQQWPCSQCG